MCEYRTYMYLIVLKAPTRCNQAQNGGNNLKEGYFEL